MLALGRRGTSSSRTRATDSPEAATNQQTIAERRKEAVKNKKKPTGRQPWPADLGIEVQLEPDCDLEGMKKIGEKRTKTDYTPLRYLSVLVRPVYAAPEPDAQTGKTRVVTAELPSRPMPKRSVSTNLLAIIICDKFLDHLPLYRQMKRYERLNVKISNLSGWIKESVRYYAPREALIKK